ncbi:MAG TPA: serine/threonine-protein kinase [Terriglobales bacterium]|nr:serine/threonine-protein kinase [Terriglobales bacterium]
MRLPEYELLEKLNADGCAELFRARDPEGNIVTLHDPSHRARAFADPDDTASFTAYLREVAALQHPNIERITEVGTQTVWFAAEYFDYPLSLDGRIRSKQAMSAQEKVRIVRDVLAGLGYAHQRDIVHTAVNPTNITVLESGQAKLLNFVEGWQTRRALRRGAMSGATHYLAPEFILDGQISPAMDIFACGVLLYRLLAKSFPFQGKDGPSVVQAILHSPPRPVGEHCSGCAEKFGGIFERALAKVPARRYREAEEFARDLAAVRL